MVAKKTPRGTFPTIVAPAIRSVAARPGRTDRASRGVGLRLRSRSSRGPRQTTITSKPDGTFDFLAFLDSAGTARRVVEYHRGGVIFAQGGPCENVLYIQAGSVKLSVVSKTGRQAVVAMLGPGDFFGEGCLAGQPVRMGSATAATRATILFVGQVDMARLLHEQNTMSDLLIAHLLSRTIRIEEDLVDQLFSSSEKRLARKLLLLARFGERGTLVRAVPAISQETLAEMVGTTRSRVNFFMKKFERLGFIDYKNGLRVHDSLFTVVLHD